MTSRNYQVLLDLVKASNPVTDADGVLLYPGVPVPVAGQDTLIPIVSKGAVNPFKGQVLFNYRRLELDKLFKGFEASISAPAGRLKYVWDLIPYLNTKYGLELTTGDLVQAAIDTRTLPTTVTVTANPDSLYYLGEFQLEITLGAIELSSLELDIGALKYPAGLTTLTQAPVLSYSYEANVFKDVLSKLQPGERSNLNLALLLCQVSGVNWKFLATRTAKNFYQSVVYYNGLVSDVVLPSDVDFSLNQVYVNVLLLKLSDTYCTDTAGLVSIYY